MKKFCTILLVLVVVLTMLPTTFVSAATTKNIIGYFPEWRIYDTDGNAYRMSMVPWDKITHLNYAFAIITNGRLTMYDTYAAPIHFSEMRTMKAAHPHVKTIISVGGWTRSEWFHDVSSDATKRQTFASSCVDFIRQNGFDGVDIDWEYPCVYRPASGQYDKGNPAGPEDKHNFTLLLQTLRQTLDTAGVADGKHYILSIAAPTDPDKMALQEPNLYHQYLDYINVMTYDMHGNWDSVTGHLSPLYRNPNEPASFNPKWNTDSGMKELVNVYGVPKSKLNVGAPFYSRGWGGVQPGPNNDGMFQTATGPTPVGVWDSPSDGQGQNPFYKMKQLESDPSYTKFRDPYSKVPWLYSASQKILYTYEDEQSLQERCNLVISNDYAGMMFWEVSGEYPKAGGSTMTGIIATAFGFTPPGADTQAPTAPSNLASSNITSTSVNLSWTASTDNVGVTGYDIYKNGTFLKTVTTTSDTVTGLTASTTYTFKVKAKDAAGNASADSNTVSVTTTVATADTQAPTAPSNLTSSNVTSTSVTLSWTASTDNVGVTGYDIYKNGTFLKTVTTTSDTVTGLTASTTYTFKVKAKDAAGNVSADSNTVSVTTSASGGTATRIEAESYTARSSTAVGAVTVTDGTSTLGLATRPNEWTSYNNVDLTGKSTISIRFSNAYAATTIEIRVGSQTGTLIGTASTPLTGGWNTFNTLDVSISGATGSQNVYLVYKSNCYDYLNWFEVK